MATAEELRAELRLAEAQILAELERVAAERKRLDDRRDELVRDAMRTDLPRADIAAAAGLTLGRLYQIQKGGR
jgi:hypothetical protein